MTEEEWNQPVTAAPVMGARPRPLIEQFAAAFMALRNCQQREAATPWEAVWEGTLEELAREFLPSGSGFDSGSRFLLDESRPDRLIFATSFHHMNDGGFYDGWTEHRVIVTPSFVGGFDLKVTGRDKRQIKEYIAESFAAALAEPVLMPDH